ncbi:MAG TPA: NAD(P)-binding domain-containing protein [Candidatus Dormibacteraeota bacterium]|nr:NAD(P)-binding domain-containing protein [Candidatus Dormibacteraeota bacterium]
MATAIIGIGNLGGTVARELAAGGEPVILSASSQSKAKKLAAEIGGGASAALNNRDAVQRADNVVFALWLSSTREVIGEVVDLLPGKLVIDPSNPVSVAADGTLTRTLPEGQSSGEVVASWLPQGARFVKAFGSMGATQLASNRDRKPKRAVLFYAADDAEAAAEIERLIQIAGFDPVRAGQVATSARIEVGGDLHPWGGLNGRLLEREEATSLVDSADQSVRAK